MSNKNIKSEIIYLEKYVSGSGLITNPDAIINNSSNEKTSLLVEDSEQSGNIKYKFNCDSIPKMSSVVAIDCYVDYDFGDTDIQNWIIESSLYSVTPENKFSYSYTDPLGVWASLKGNYYKHTFHKCFNSNLGNLELHITIRKDGTPNSDAKITLNSVKATVYYEETTEYSNTVARPFNIFTVTENEPKIACLPDSRVYLNKNNQQRFYIIKDAYVCLQDENGNKTWKSSRSYEPKETSYTAWAEFLSYEDQDNATIIWDTDNTYKMTETYTDVVEPTGKYGDLGRYFKQALSLEIYCTYDQNNQKTLIYRDLDNLNSLPNVYLSDYTEEERDYTSYDMIFMSYGGGVDRINFSKLLKHETKIEKGYDKGSYEYKQTTTFTFASFKTWNGPKKLNYNRIVTDTNSNQYPDNYDQYENNSVVYKKITKGINN